MTDHPPATNASESPKGINWGDHATLHRGDDGAGVLYAMKAVRRGTLAEMVSFVMSLPESERSAYVIEKAGDHRLGAGEIRALAARADFPR